MVRGSTKLTATVAVEPGSLDNIDLSALEASSGAVSIPGSDTAVETAVTLEVSRAVRVEDVASEEGLDADRRLEVECAYAQVIGSDCAKVSASVTGTAEGEAPAVELVASFDAAEVEQAKAAAETDLAASLSEALGRRGRRREPRYGGNYCDARGNARGTGARRRSCGHWRRRLARDTVCRRGDDNG